MSEFAIIVQRDQLDNTLDRLRGIAHLKEVELPDTKPVFADLVKIGGTISRIEALSGLFKSGESGQKSSSPVMDAEDVANEAELEVKQLEIKKHDANARIAELNSMLQLLDTVEFIGKVDVFGETFESWERLREEFKRKKLTVVGTRVAEHKVLVVAKGSQRGFQGDAGRVRSQINAQIKKEQAILSETDAQFAQLKQKYGGRTNTLRDQLDKELRFMNEKRKIAHSELFVVIRGWVPDRNIGKIDVEGVVLTQDAGPDAPTKLDNPWLFKPFENFMYIFALPEYGEFDPTAFIAVFFPLFFGVMLSDAGYGMMLLFLALQLRKKYRLFAELLVLPALATIMFGVIFDSYFGFSTGHVIINPLIRPFELIRYAVIFGVFYIDLGLIMGIIQNLLKDEYMEALKGQISFLMVQFGVALALWKPIIGIPVFLLGFAIKVWAEQLRGVLSVPGFISSILSFSRLAALAMATSWIAFVVNFLTGLILKLPFGPVPAIIFWALGHIGNFGLNTFGAFIHALRLHYVEFMNMFFSAKGKAFTPLGS